MLSSGFKNVAFPTTFGWVGQEMHEFPMNAVHLQAPGNRPRGADSSKFIGDKFISRKFTNKFINKFINEFTP